MAITWTDVENVAPSLSTVAAGAQTAILAHVNATLSESKLGDRFTMAASYLAAHFGAITQFATRAGGPVESEKVGDVSVSYAIATGSGDYSATSYGQQYCAIVRTVAAYRIMVV